MKIAITQSGKIYNYNGSSEYGEPSIILNEKEFHDLVSNISEFKTNDNIFYDTFDTVIERENLIKNIAKVFDMDNPYDIFKRKRRSKYVYPRHLYIAMLVTKSSMSTSQIGRMLGYSHCTILYATSKANDMLRDREYGPKYNHIMSMYGVTKFQTTNQ